MVAERRPHGSTSNTQTYPQTGPESTATCAVPKEKPAASASEEESAQCSATKAEAPPASTPQEGCSLSESKQPWFSRFCAFPF